MSESNPFLFREATEPVVTQPQESVRTTPVDTPSENIEIEPSFLEYRSVTGRPFVADFFGINEAYTHLPKIETDKMEVIESYLESKIRSKQYLDTKESITEIMGELETKLGLSPNLNPYERIDKISDLLNVVPDPLGRKEVVENKPKKSRVVTVLKNKLSKVNEEITQKEEMTKRVNAKLRSEQSAKKLLEKEVGQQGKVIRSLEDQLLKFKATQNKAEDLASKLVAREKEIIYHETKLNEAKAKLSVKESEISTLTKELNSANRELKNYDTELKKKDNVNRDLETKLTKQNLAFKRLMGDLN